MDVEAVHVGEAPLPRHLAGGVGMVDRATVDLLGPVAEADESVAEGLRIPVLPEAHDREPAVDPRLPLEIGAVPAPRLGPARCAIEAEGHGRCLGASDIQKQALPLGQRAATADVCRPEQSLELGPDDEVQPGDVGGHRHEGQRLLQGRVRLPFSRGRHSDRQSQHRGAGESSGVGDSWSGQGSPPSVQPDPP